MFKIKNSAQYIILWVTGCIVASSIFFLWNNADKPQKVIIFNNLNEVVKRDNISQDIVNELLLSANELNIYGHSSLIEYNFNEENPANSLLFEQIKANPKNAYQTILKNKIKNIQQKQAASSDFKILPVPK